MISYEFEQLDRANSTATGIMNLLHNQPNVRIHITVGAGLHVSNEDNSYLDVETAAAVKKLLLDWAKRTKIAAKRMTIDLHRRAIDEAVAVLESDPDYKE